VGLAAGLTLLVIALGCMSFSIERPEHVTYVGRDAVLEQKGDVTVHSGEIVDVYYPIPYGSPPNLTIDDSFHHYEVIDQKPGFFRLRNKGGGWPSVKWVARGIRAPVQSPPALVPEETPPVIVPTSGKKEPANSLPPEPVPVGEKP
jgi:hypothetical protein